MGLMQTGIISPSKLRMKLMGQQRKKEGSNSNSARTSPSKLQDTEFVRNSLLASDLEDFYEQGQLLSPNLLTQLEENVVLLTSCIYHTL